MNNVKIMKKKDHSDKQTSDMLQPEITAEKIKDHWDKIYQRINPSILNPGKGRRRKFL